MHRHAEGAREFAADDISQPLRGSGNLRILQRANGQRLVDGEDGRDGRESGML